MSDILLKIIRESLLDVHIETGLKDEFDNVCIMLARDLTDSYQEEINSLKSKNKKLKGCLEFCLPYADFALQGQMFSKGLSASREVLKETPQKCLADVRSEAVKEFVSTGISPNSKAGCIGEFTMTTTQTCPECWENQDDNCELCHGETDENGQGDLELDIPWTSQKEIFMAMLGFKFEHYSQQLRNSHEKG